MAKEGHAVASDDFHEWENALKLLGTCRDLRAIEQIAPSLFDDRDADHMPRSEATVFSLEEVFDHTPGFRPEVYA